MTGNEEVEDLTHLEKLMFSSESGRMTNVMKGSIQRFRSSSTRRKKKPVAQLDDQSDEENLPTCAERSPQDSEGPSPRTEVWDRKGSGPEHKPLWDNFPHRISVTEKDAETDRRGYAVYVPGDLENESRKPKVLDYFSTTSAYCFNDHRFRPIKSDEPQAPRSRKDPAADADELDDATACGPDESPLEGADLKDRPKRDRKQPKPKEKVAPKQPAKPVVKLKAWEDEKDAAPAAPAAPVSTVLGGFVSSALGLAEPPQDQAAKERQALDTLLKAKAERPKAQMTEGDRGSGI